MRDIPRPVPNRDLDSPAEIAEMVRRFHETLELGWIGPNARRAAELADNVARVHSHQLLGHSVSLSSGAPI